LANIKKSLFLK